MSSTTTTVLFRNAEPIAGNTPTFNRANFSIYPFQQPIQVATANIPRIYVTSDYGSGTSQKELADAYRAGSSAKNDLVLYVEPKERGTPQALKFQELYDAKATEYVSSSLTTSSKGKKRGVPLDGVSVFTPEGYLKMKIDPAVWEAFRETIPVDRRPDDVLGFPMGDTVWVIFVITGVWHNATQYGQTVRVKRMQWKSAGEAKLGNKVVEFIEDDEDEVSASIGNI